MKSVTFAHADETLLQLNLSQMDFPDGPVAIHSIRITYSDLIQSAGPNKLMHPEISMRNHRIFTYSFLGSGPAIFPDTEYLLVPV